MIRLSFGNVGSGKTASVVRSMYLDRSGRKTYSNIKTKIKHQIDIDHSMIVKKEVESIKKDGTPVYKLKLNIDFWKGIKEPINVVIDEAHAVMNPRRAMSKVNIIMTDWMALLRRVLGETEAGYGELVLITQLERRIDIIAKEMATKVSYHVCHYKKECKKCHLIWIENSEMPEPLWSCPKCGSYYIKKFDHKIQVWDFANIDDYKFWREFGQNTSFKQYIIHDIEKYFKLYNTLQWDNLFSELY